MQSCGFFGASATAREATCPRGTSILLHCLSLHERQDHDRTSHSRRHATVDKLSTMP